MLRVVLPLVTLASLAPVDVPVYVFVKIIVVVDVDVAVVPIAIAPMAAPSAPRGGTQRNPRAPHQSCPWHVAWIGVGIVRILGRRRTVNDGRVVRGNIHHVRVSILNCNHLFPALD